MRKRRLIAFLMSISLIPMMAVLSYADVGAGAGKVLLVKKKVYRVRADKWEDAKVKMVLNIKDVVETDSASRTKLFFSDDSILNLGELSRVKVEEYLYNSETERSKSIYRLIDGSLKVVVGRGDLEVHTATAVAAARGTAFIMFKGKSLKYEKDKKQTCVMVLDSNVEFRLKKEAITKNTKQDKVILNKGRVSCIEGENIGDPFPIDQVMISKWNNSFSVIATEMPENNELPAFAPEPEVEPQVVAVDIPVDIEPKIDSEPVTEPEPELPPGLPGPGEDPETPPEPELPPGLPGPGEDPEAPEPELPPGLPGAGVDPEAPSE